jgi:hypothetical protein
MIDLGDIATINGHLMIYPSGLTFHTTVVASQLRNITEELTILYDNTTAAISSVNVSMPELAYVGQTFTIRAISDSIIFEEAANLTLGDGLSVWESTAGGLQLPGVAISVGRFDVDDNPEMFNLDVPDLQTVQGSSFSISRNEALTYVGFKSLKEVWGKVNIEGNTVLEDIEFPMLKNAQSVYVTQNGRQTKLLLPSLGELGNENTTFNNNYFTDVVQIDLSGLVNVTGKLEFTTNTFSSLVLDRLRNVTTELIVEENEVLDTLALPRLESVGTVTVSDNRLLTNITANQLRVADSISITGNQTTVEFFGLEQVTGNFEIEGPPSMDCSWFDDNFFQKVVKGSYRCVGNHTKPDTEPGPSTGPPPSDSTGSGDVGDEKPGGSDETSNAGLSTGAKAGIGAGVGVAALVIIAAIAFFLWKRKKQQSQQKQAMTDVPGTGKPELDATPVEVAKGGAQDSGSPETSDDKSPDLAVSELSGGKTQATTEFRSATSPSELPSPPSASELEHPNRGARGQREVAELE